MSSVRRARSIDAASPFVEYGYASTIHANQRTGAPVVIGSITQSDDARSAHVTFTRAEQILHIHTHLTREEIVEQLTSDRSLAAKDDALLFAAIVDRTGGPDTMWARAVKTAREFDGDPLRKRHETVMAQRADDFRKAIVNILDGQPGIKRVSAIASCEPRPNAMRPTPSSPGRKKSERHSSTSGTRTSASHELGWRKKLASSVLSRLLHLVQQRAST